MCGISGIIDRRGNIDIVPLVRKMNDVLRHRGPDDEGYLLVHQDKLIAAGGNGTPRECFSYESAYNPSTHIEEVGSNNYHLGLAHRRLNVIDLSPAGHQPMCNTSAGTWIVYNGEIYNHPELREELKSKGYKFKTTSDTEVLLHAYEAWGNDMLEKLNGMWAFVIYDRKRNMLWGSRDRTGVKPLYYHVSEALFSFASEMKALLHLPVVSKRLDDEAVFNYLVLDKVEYSQQSLFSDIQELPAGHYFKYDLSSGNFDTSCYHQVRWERKWEKFNKKKSEVYSDELYRLLKEAIRIRLRSDIPVAACLSGGIDSSSIVTMIHELRKKQGSDEKLTTFTACFPNIDSDESGWARKVSDMSSAEWVPCDILGAELPEHLTDLVYTQDIPFFSLSVFSQYMLMKHIHEHGVKVTIDGQGCDELMTGYRYHYAIFMAQALKKLDFSAFLSNKSKNYPKNFADNGLVLELQLKRMMANVSKEMLLKTYKNRHVATSYIKPGLWQCYGKHVQDHFQQFVPDLNKFLHHQYYGGDLKALLKAGDRSSMRFSVETRTPFADDVSLAAFCFNIPGSYKIHNGYSKYQLRNAVKHILPRAITQRRDKIGFATPEHKWMQIIKPYLKDMLPTGTDDYINYDLLRKDIDRLIDKEAVTDTARVWRLINFGLWKKVYQL